MTTGIFCLCCCCCCVPHSNAYQPVENGAPLCLVLHKSLCLAWGKGKKKKQKKEKKTLPPKGDEYMIRGFTAQIDLGFFYSSPLPLFLSQAASPAGLALHPTPSFSCLAAPVWFTFHFTLAPPLSTRMLLLLSLTPSPVWPDLLIAFSILQYWVAFHHLAGGIKRCKIFSVR